MGREVVVAIICYFEHTALYESMTLSIYVPALLFIHLKLKRQCMSCYALSVAVSLGCHWLVVAHKAEDLGEV